MSSKSDHLSYGSDHSGRALNSGSNHSGRGLRGGSDHSGRSDLSPRAILKRFPSFRSISQKVSDLDVSPRPRIEAKTVVLGRLPSFKWKKEESERSSYDNYQSNNIAACTFRGMDHSTEFVCAAKPRRLSLGDPPGKLDLKACSSQRRHSDYDSSGCLSLMIDSDLPSDWSFSSNLSDSIDPDIK